MKQLEKNILNVLEKENKTNNKIKYTLEKDISKALEIAYFYDQNWLGNKDFMHIPNVEDVVDNILYNYVIIARSKEDNRIVGASTIKYYDEIQAYYPTDNTFFNLTGLLTERNNTNNKIKGIGVNLYRICMESILRTKTNADIIAEVDCRNINSLIAFNKASNINNCHSYITGMYTSYKNYELCEAPTLIVRTSISKPDKLSYMEDKIDCSDDKYFSYSELLNKLIDQISFKKHETSDNETVYYGSLDKIDLGHILDGRLYMTIPNNKNRIPKMKRLEKKSGVSYG